VVAPRRWAGPDDILAVAASRGEPPRVLVLDSLEDPQNVGTLLRTAEASGVHGAVFPTRHQAPLSPAAVKASAGAVEHLALSPVDDLPGTLADLHARGLRIVGADGEAPLTAREADLRGPVAIVVGSEGQGLGPAIRRRCDLLVRIPMHGRIESLNAAVAGSILLYEAAAQRRLPDPGPRVSGPDESAVEAEPVEPPAPTPAITAPAEAAGDTSALTSEVAPDARSDAPPSEPMPKPARARKPKAVAAAEPKTAGPTAEPKARRARQPAAAAADQTPASDVEALLPEHRTAPSPEV
jgi:23S rRNA (guanosine2251-2'-O)-methyltransferase